MAKNGMDGISPIRLAPLGVPMVPQDRGALAQGGPFGSARDGERKSNREPVEPPAAERYPTKPEVRQDGESRSCERQFAEDTRKDGREESSAAAEASTHPTFRSHRELGTAILAAGNPVEAGRELLEKETSDDRGAATRLKSLQTFADWAFERPGTDGYRKPPRIIWDIPGPPYEPLDPELEKLEGGEK